MVVVLVMESDGGFDDFDGGCGRGFDDDSGKKFVVNVRVIFSIMTVSTINRAK